MTMHSSPPPASPQPVWEPVTRARSDLARTLDALVADIAAGAPDIPRALALRVPPGLGKTRSMLEALARHGAGLLEQGHVLFYVPTLALAERAAVEFAALQSGLPHRVIRGRGAPQPATDAAMCRKHELVARISGLVRSVTSTLCRARAEGHHVEAPCAHGCPYLAQLDDPQFRIHFLAHSYLAAQPPIDPDAPVALRVIDEKVWPALLRTSRISVDEVMRPPASTFPADLRDALARAKSAIIDGLQRNRPLHDHLAELGIDTELLLKLAAAEEDSVEQLRISPGDAPQSVAFRVDTFDVAGYRASRSRAALFRALAARADGPCNRITLRNSEGRQVIRVHKRKALPTDAPLVMLDADADAGITQALLPGAVLRSVDVKPEAEIVQVGDRVLSNHWLLDPARGPQRRAGIARIIRREVARATGAGVLLVATKPVLAALHADAGHAPDSAAALRQPLLGAVPRWFGPSTQGVNDFEGFTSVIILGRLQPATDSIEDLARCLHGDDPEPFEDLPPGPLPATQVPRLLADGTLHPAQVRGHPDPRCDAVLRQLRECSAAQAAARLRLLAPDRPKRVLLLGSTPLPGLPPTRLVSLDTLVAGLEDEPDPAGYLQLHKALRAQDGTPVRGTRLSAAGLASDLPRDFVSPGAAKEFRRGRTTPGLRALIGRIAQAEGWPMTALSLRKPGGGQPVPALVFAPPAQAIQVARALWPGLAAEIFAPSAPA